VDELNHPTNAHKRSTTKIVQDWLTRRWSIVFSPMRSAQLMQNRHFTHTAAFGTRKPTLITSTKAIFLIILSLVAALIERYPFAVAAARSPL
jgi:hypothetical protein